MVRSLLALDLGSTTRALTRAAAQVSAHHDVEVVIAHALSPLAGPDFPSAEAECLSAAERIQATGGRVSSTLILRVSSPEDLILTSAQELGVALIVMGLGQAQRLGSTARGVLRAAPCSLLLVGQEQALDLASGEGLSRLSLQDLPPLARLAALTRQLSLEPEAEALLAEVDSSHPFAALSRGVAS